MDVKAYIESGVLESVALGTATDQEIREVACLGKIYPEIQGELERLEKALEGYAHAHQVIPPEGLREQVLAAIDNCEEDQKAAADVIEMPTVVTGKNTFSWAMAAAVAALAVLGTLYVFECSQTETLKREMAATNDRLMDQADSLMESSDVLRSELAVLKDTANIQIHLGGTPNQPGAHVTIYWNKSTGSVHLLANNLQNPPKGSQYQLWGIANGTPVDAGVFDVDEGIALQSMKDLSDAQAFAVTLEKEGGSPTPTLESMVVIGQI